MSFVQAHCAAAGTDPDAPVAAYRTQLAAAHAAALAAPPELAPQSTKRVAAYTAACGSVRDDVLSQWAHAKLGGSPEALWALKKALAAQLACASLLGYALSVGQRAPHTLGVSAASGRLVATDFHPCYRPGSAAIDANEVGARNKTRTRESRPRASPRNVSTVTLFLSLFLTPAPFSFFFLF